MRRRRLVVPVLLALSGLGWAAAHALAHRAAMAEAAMSQGVVGRYLSYLTTSFALCATLALALAAGTLAGRRWTGASARSLWLFGLVPVLGFVGHTAAEPLFSATGSSASFTSLAPTALVGLLVQIPFALVAVGFARHVLWLAERLARVEIAPFRIALPATAPSYLLPSGSCAPAFRLDFAHTERGPPLLGA